MIPVTRFTIASSSMLKRSVASAASKNKGASCSVARHFSSQCEPAEKIRHALADYQRLNYTRETPRRFKKEVLSPYAVDDSVDVDQLNRLLKNIGRADDCLSTTEQNELLQEAGCAGRSIPLPKLTELLN